MQRIPVPGGRLSAPHLKTIADIAVRHTGQTALHLTTRQSIELHNIPEPETSTVLAELHDAGLPTLGAGGDNVRTVTVCPCCAADPEAFDVAPLAKAVNDFLSVRRPQYQLPRKFKITLYGCRQPQSKPFFNCLALGALSPNTVRVIGAGSLGPRPEPGIPLYEDLPIRDIGALIEAALALFDKYGNRENRRQARFRHIRAVIGDDAFRIILNDLLEQKKKECSSLELTLSPGAHRLHKVTFQTIAGELRPFEARLIAEMAQHGKARIQINLHHGIDLYSDQTVEIPAPLASMMHLPCIVACPGSDTCTNGLVHCMDMAARLSAALKDNPSVHGKTIALSGCPNNCAQSSIADIGLIGRLQTVADRRQEAYQLLLGGDNGRSGRMAEPFDVVPANELAARIKLTISHGDRSAAPKTT